MPYIIAEIGQNHNGSLQTAKDMVDSLIGTGVRAIKTAKRDVNSFPDSWKTLEYKGENSFADNYYDHRCALELSNDEFKEFARYSRLKGFDFISSFTDIASFDFLVKQIKQTAYKIASSRVKDYKLLRYVREFNVPVILSTGMSDLRDVLIAFDLVQPDAVMQCTSAYPNDLANINLNVLKLYRQKFNKSDLGLSGHHFGILPDILAYNMGAKLIERHYTLDKNAKGTDHCLSLNRDEFIELHENLLKVDIIQGREDKTVLFCEKKAIEKLRSDL